MKTLNDATFNKIFEAKDDRLVYVLFWHPWCQPCKVFKRTFGLFAKQNTDCDFYLASVTEAPGAAAGQKIVATPTVVVWREGRVVGRAEGALDLEELQDGKKKMLR